MYILQCTMYTVYCLLYTVQCTAYNGISRVCKVIIMHRIIYLYFHFLNIFIIKLVIVYIYVCISMICIFIICLNTANKALRPRHTNVLHTCEL